MFAVGFILIALGLLGDILFPIFLSTLHIKFSLCSLFLFFSVLRFSTKYTALMLSLYVLLAYPFTGLSFVTIFLSFFVVLVVVYKLREKIYTETYVGKAVLVFLESAAQMFLLHFFNHDKLTVVSIATIFPQLLIQSVVNAMLSLPVFIVLDILFDFLSGRGILEFNSSYKRLVD